MTNKKQEKNKGRNKKRPGPMKFDRSSKLCPTLVDVSPECTILQKCTFPNCQFQHDAKTFLANKVIFTMIYPYIQYTISSKIKVMVSN